MVKFIEQPGKSTEEIHSPADINWEMLDKSKFFFLGTALFSTVSAALYPAILLKTRQQVAQSKLPCLKTAFSIVKLEGFHSLYRGFSVSLLGTIPARTLYIAALEVTKSKTSTATTKLGFKETTTSAISNSVGGLTASMAAQLVWTPVDVVSQRLMVQGGGHNCKYVGAIEVFRKLGFRGLYRGFGISVLTCAPSSAVWWGSYSVSQGLVCSGIGVVNGDTKTVIAVQGASAAMAASVSALMTMPLDTIKTRLQVLDGDGDGDGNGSRRVLSLRQTIRALVKEGGWLACYRGLGARCASMSMSATAMITTYEFLKRISTKSHDV